MSGTYLHLGGQYVVPRASVAGIFDIDNTTSARSTREMLAGMGAAAACFFAAFLALRPAWGNHALWTAFLLYLFMRGAVQALFLPKIMRRIGR